jgi:hypothetical protein
MLASPQASAAALPPEVRQLFVRGWPSLTGRSSAGGAGGDPRGKDKGGAGRASAKSLPAYSKITSNGMFGAADPLLSSVLLKLKKPEKDTSATKSVSGEGGGTGGGKAGGGEKDSGGGMSVSEFHEQLRADTGQVTRLHSIFK